MVWRIELTATAAKQLGKLGKGEAKRITTFLRQVAAFRDVAAGLPNFGNIANDEARP